MVSAGPNTATQDSSIMPTTLQDIADRTRETVDAACAQRSLAELQSLVDACPPPRDFFGAVTGLDGQGAVNVVAEFRDKVPPGCHRPAERGAGRYCQTIRQCRSRGDFLPDRRSVLRRLAGRPGHHSGDGRSALLRKDFMIDPYRVWEARIAGADAILLIAELLSVEQIADMAALAGELGLTSLIEVHDLDNLHRIEPHLHGRRLLGVNNRNLRTMTTDLAHVEAMLDSLTDHMEILVCSPASAPAMTSNDSSSRAFIGFSSAKHCSGRMIPGRPSMT